MSRPSRMDASKGGQSVAQQHAPKHLARYVNIVA